MPMILIPIPVAGPKVGPITAPSGALRIRAKAERKTVAQSLIDSLPAWPRLL